MAQDTRSLSGVVAAPSPMRGDSFAVAYATPCHWEHRRNFAASLQGNLRYAMSMPDMLRVSKPYQVWRRQSVAAVNTPCVDPVCTFWITDTAQAWRRVCLPASSYDWRSTVPGQSSGRQSLRVGDLTYPPGPSDSRFWSLMAERDRQAGEEAVTWRSLVALHQGDQHPHGRSSQPNAECCLTPEGLALLRRKKPWQQRGKVHKM
jgi:hypothetical protein